MGKAFKSKYRPKNPKKYINQKRLKDIVCRSSWERHVCIWCDNHTDVVAWGSEEVVIPYISKVDGKQHRYYIDFYIKFKSGKVYLVEVKPKYQTQAPVPKTGQAKKRLIQETTTYATNMSKWEAASVFAAANKAKFVVWTEIELEKMGMRLQVSKAFRYAKYAKKKKSPKRVKHATKK
jgi:hypothetical protein